jgi:glycosyltransferase involved in cell wall biosynthesis
MILLTLLIPCVLDRLGSPLLVALQQQAAKLPPGREVEILALYDNRQRSIGLKRQMLLDAAQGQFIACLDDDDGVAPDYFEQLTKAIVDNPEVDVIVFDEIATLNGENPFRVRCGLEYENEQAATIDGVWQNIHRKPWHWCAWNARLAKNARFPDGYVDEDWYWLKQMLPLAKTQHRIDRALHLYVYNSQTSLANQGAPTVSNS